MISNGVRYFVVNIATNATQVDFQSFNMTGSADMFIKLGQLPAPNFFDYSSANAGSADEMIPQTLPPLSPGDWFIAIVNVDTVPVDFDLLVLATPPPPPLVNGPVIKAGANRFNGTGLNLKWAAPAGQKFKVQYSNVLPAIWQTIPTVISSATGQFEFNDNGSQTGGANAQRFYRLIQVP